MTPEERLEAHELWLRDHDRIIAEISQIQRQQAAVLLELTQQIVRVIDKLDGRTDGPA
jgi:hypothetical protein